MTMYDCELWLGDQNLGHYQTSVTVQREMAPIYVIGPQRTPKVLGHVGTVFAKIDSNLLADYRVRVIINSGNDSYMIFGELLEGGAFDQHSWVGGLPMELP